MKPENQGFIEKKKKLYISTCKMFNPHQPQSQRRLWTERLITLRHKKCGVLKKEITRRKQQEATQTTYLQHAETQLPKWITRCRRNQTKETMWNPKTQTHEKQNQRKSTPKSCREGTK